MAKTYLMGLALTAEVLHALLMDVPADDLGSAAASEAAASITETVVQRLEDLNARFPGRFEPAEILLEMVRRRQVFHADDRV